ncbi:MAG: histidine phosphatase family protein [Candidatus Micrarchaeota archaeon]
MAKKLMLLRHGEAASNKEKFFAGWTDTALTELGIMQAKHLGKRLEKEKFDCIFCSDLQRAKKTLELAGIKGRMIFAKELREKNYGELEGKRWGGRKEYYMHHVDPYAKAPGGENYKEVQERVVKYFYREINTGRQGNVLIVSHHGPIVMLACHLMGIGLENWRALRMGNAGLSIFEKEGKRFRLTLWNSLSRFGMETNRRLIEE